MKFTIDPEFQHAIPPLTAEELEQLTTSLCAEGCRDPLVVWDGVLIDGHHRYAICAEYDIPFQTVSMTFIDRDAAMDWMDANQLGRRNLTPDQASLLRGRRYNRLKKKEGGRADRTFGEDKVSTPKTADTLAKQHGVNERTIRRDGKRAEVFEQLKVKAPEAAQAVMDGKKRFHEVRRDLKRAEVIETAALPSSTYRVLYADPPWQYGDHLTEDYGATKFHYPDMSIPDLCALPIKALAQDDAVLFLWVTSPFLYEAFPIIAAWGFQYKTSFVWDKIKHNMGHYNSVRHELLLVCTRGSCLPDVPQLFDSVQSIERSGKHSEKPDEFRRIIDTLYPHGKRLELFARGKQDGWDIWGNEPV